MGTRIENNFNFICFVLCITIFHFMLIMLFNGKGNRRKTRFHDSCELADYSFHN